MGVAIKGLFVHLGGLSYWVASAFLSAGVSGSVACDHEGSISLRSLVTCFAG